MRRRSIQSAVVLAIGAVALTSASPASAAHPKHSTRYSGSGRLCENNAAGHHFTNCAGRNRFSFRTSATGSRVTAFSGRIGPFYCGGASSTITFKSIEVGSKGGFSARFSTPNVVGGKVNGTSHIVLRGRFTSATKAQVFYRLVTHFNNTPSSQDCGAQVSGTAHAK